MIARRGNTGDKGNNHLPAAGVFGMGKAGRKSACNVLPALTTQPVSEVPMALESDRANPPAVQHIPIVVMDQRKAERAYAVHCALLFAERADPALRENPEWTLHRQDAYERFALAFKAIV